MLAETSAVEDTPIYHELREALGDPGLPVEGHREGTDPAVGQQADGRPD